MDQPINLQQTSTSDVIPPAVKKMAADADRLQREFIASMGGELPPEVPITPATPTPGPEVRPQPTNPETPVPPVSPVVNTETPVQPTRPAALAPLVDDDSPAPPGSSAEVWEQRYKSYRGRAERNMQLLQSQVTELSNAIQELQNRQPEPAPITQPGNINLRDFGITQEELDTVGPEFVGIIEKAAHGIAQAHIKQALGDVKPQLEQVSQQATAARYEAFINNNLDTYLMPKYGVGFAEINKDRNFLQFLQLTPPLSSDKLHTILRSAWASFNAPLILQIVDQFLGTTPAPESNNPAPAPVIPAASRAQIPLVSLAAPGTGRAPPAPAPVAQEKPIYTRAEVQEYYRQVQKGHLRNDPAKRAEYDAEIALAAAEGRIR